MRFDYRNVSLKYEIVSNNIYKLEAPNDFIVETYKLGIFDDEIVPKFNAVLELSDSANQELVSQSLYVSRGICMHDKNPIGISFGGLIGKFTLPNSVEYEIDKDVNRVAYFYLIQAQ